MFGTLPGGVLEQPLQVGGLVQLVRLGVVLSSCSVVVVLGQQVLVGGCTPGIVWAVCWCHQELWGGCTPGRVLSGYWVGRELLQVSGLCQ